MAEDPLQRMKNRRGGHKAVITTTLKKAQDQTGPQLKKLIAVVEVQLETVRGLNNSIAELLPVAEIAAEIETSLDHETGVELELIGLKDKMDDQGQGQNGVSTHSLDNSSLFALDPTFSIGASPIDVRLTRIELPTFDGDTTRWQEFWDAFSPAVHQNTKVPIAEKFARLRKQLTGRAAKVIGGFATTTENYQKALELLYERFGQPHTIAQSHTTSVIELPAPSLDFFSLEQFYDETETHIRGLEALGHTESNYGDVLAPIIMAKLPSEIRQAMTRSHGSTDWTLAAVRRLLKQELDARRPIHTEQASMLHSQMHGKPPQQGRYPPKDQPRAACTFCNKDHASASCSTVTDITRRKQIITERRLCFNCLRRGHAVSSCRSTGRCRKCQRKHHTAICQPQHDPQPAATNISTSDTEPAVSPAPVQSINASPAPTQSPETSPVPAAIQAISLIEPPSEDCCQLSVPSTASGILLQTAIAPAIINGVTTTARILFDSGAQRTIASRAFVSVADTDLSTFEEVSFSGVADERPTVRRLPKVSFRIKCRDGKHQEVSALVLNHVTAPLRTKNSTIPRFPYLRDLPLAHPVLADHEFTIDVLLGADHYWDFVEPEQPITGNGPTALKSKLGFLLSGPLRGKNQRESSPTQVHSAVSLADSISQNRTADNDDVTELLEKFWTLESFGITPEKPISSEEDFRVEYQEKCLRLEDGKYVARLPWKEEFPDLPTNFRLAEKMTKSIFNRLPLPTKILYDNIIKEQERRGFIEKVAEDASSSHRIHYIPHHPVVKESSTTPLRVVYHCSAKMKNNPSLNDCLRSTPPILSDIPTILTQSRICDHMVISDLEKAFLHVGLHPDDRDATRFLWPVNPLDADPTWITWRFKSILFGATSSGFVLDATIRRHLADNPCPAATTILEGLYVDNIVNSFDSASELLEYFHEARSLMKQAGFNLRAWKSSYQPLNDLAVQSSVLDDTPQPKVLGLIWNPEEDTLSYPPYQPTNMTTVTKREVTSAIAKIYDPLGILGPVVIRAKILLQKLHKPDEEGNKLQWDDPIPDALSSEWSNLEADLQMVTTLKLPRRLASEDSQSETSLHVFTDSSKLAYGACIYYVSGQHATLVIARNRVAPLKELTIPRLELLSCLLGARLYSKIKHLFQTRSTHFWGDSQIVQAWLSSSKRLDLFTKNRVKEIKSLTEECEFHYCPTASNPADLLTRGIRALQLLDRGNRLWQHGPAWIVDKQSWPQPKSTTLSQMVLAADAYVMEPALTKGDENTEKSPINDAIRNASDPIRLTRTVARVIRFKENLKRKIRQEVIVTGPITLNEFKAAETLIIRLVQEETYGPEIAAIKEKKKNRPLILQLRLFIDEAKILRSAGRIHNADISEGAKFPIVLPPYHPYAAALARLAHRDAMHMGVQTTVTVLRQRFWIPQAGQVVKSVIRKCVICRKHHGKPYVPPISPPIPKMRIQDAPPFTVTGIDFSGALPIRENTGLSHVYVLLLTCAVTRNLHLEAVRNMSTPSLLQALRRFMARRGTPTIFISDNALYFQSAGRQLEALTKSPEFQTYFTNRKIAWKFIPKRSPWMGGFYERLVGLVKGCVRRSLRYPVPFDEFVSVLTEVEAVLNNRPLTKASPDVDDRDPLSPAHLMYGRPLPTIPLTLLEDDAEDATYGAAPLRRSLAAHSRRLTDAWRRFHQEYLTALREHHAAHGRTPSKVQVGDVVQVYHEGPRYAWKTAVIESLHRGADGEVRSADIRTATGRTNRPIARLYPLEIVEAEPTPKQPETAPAVPPHDRPTRAAAEKAKKRIHAILNDVDDDSDED